MKMLVCTDGSEHSRRALEKAVLLAENPHITEVAVINVYECKLDTSAAAWGYAGYSVTEEDVEHLREIDRWQKEERTKMLQNALELFKARNIDVKAMLKEGHPAQTIVEVAQDEGYEIVVVGSRGLGGLKKVLLGSVSNAIIQEAKNCCVITVK